MKRIFMMSNFLCVLIGVCSVSAQNLDWNITGAGARAAGFGGAFIGIADDATAVVWNPAGLSTLECPEVSLVNRIINDIYESEWERETDKFSQTHFAFNFLSAAYPFEFMDIKIVAAMAFQKQLDFYIYNEEEEEDYYYKFESKGGANTLTPGIGVQVTPLISAGLSANLWFGSCNFEDVYKEDGEEEEKDEWKYSFSGFNMVFGALADFSTLKKPLPLKLGLSVKSPFELDVEVEGEDEDRLSVEMPWMIGFGTSYRFGEFLTLALDYEMRAYGDSKTKQDDGEYPLSDHEENLNQFRLGAEYLLVTEFAVIPLRLGFQTVPTLLANYDDNYEPKDQVTGFGFSLGSGLIMENYAIDFTYSHSRYEQDWGNEEIYTYSNNIFTISGIYYFESLFGR